MYNSHSSEPHNVPAPQPAVGECTVPQPAQISIERGQTEGTMHARAPQHPGPESRLTRWLWYWLPPLLIMGIIFYFSNQPDLPRAPQPWLDLLLKKLAHVAEYTVLFVLLRRAWRRTLTSELALSVSLVITAAYAVSDEVHQAFVPGRHANAYDVAIDLTGVLLLWCLFRRRDAASRRRRQHPDLAE